MDERSLPAKTEMDELDKLLEEASGILMRWKYKMTSVERAEFPTVFESIDQAQNAMTWTANALTAISTELGFGILREEQPSGRPVPQTYGDWNDLGTDIKVKAGINDFETIADVNEHLHHIWNEEEYPETAQVSKMWLTRKAGELGIK